MITLANQFGGLANRQEAHIIGPSLAQALDNVNLDSEGIHPLNGLGAAVTTGSGTLRSIYKFNGNWILSTEARQYVEYGGELLYCVSGQVPKRSADGLTFHNLGITAPQAACSAAAGAAGSPNGTYLYYVVFTSSLGGKSGPSPSVSVTVASKQVSLTNIPIGLSTGDTTSGSTTVANVTNIDAWKVGMRISGSGIPAGATVSAVGASSLTLSAAATATAAGVNLTDPQFNGREIYRAGGSQSYTGLVATLSDMTTTIYTDNTADASVGTAIATVGYDVPPELDCLAVSPYGTLMGAKGRDIHFTESGKVWGWKSSNTFAANEDVVAIANYSGQFLVLTLAAPYLITGTNASTFRLINVASDQGCIGRDTVVDMGFAIFYRSPDGICAFEGRSVGVISKMGLSDSFVAGISTANQFAIGYNERYILFAEAGGSFVAGGFLEWDQRTKGNWKKGTIVANAAHYSRTDDALYLAVVADVKRWEAGDSLTYTYRTGDWDQSSEVLLKSYRKVALHHDGAVTVKVYVDGELVTFNDGTTQRSFTREEPGKSDFFLPMGTRGRYLSVEVSGTGPVREILAQVGRKARAA